MKKREVFIVFGYLFFLFVCTSVNADPESIAEKVFVKYRDANNLAYETGDSSHLKNIYSGDIETCWMKNNFNYAHSLIKPEIPADAEYAIIPIDHDKLRSLKEFGVLFHREPTNKLVISYTSAYDSSCSNRVEESSMSIYQYIHLDGNEYMFTGLCPSKELLESRAARVGKRVPGELSKPLVESVLKQLDEDEKAVIRKSASALASKAKLLDELGVIYRKYGLGLHARRIIEYELCNKNNRVAKN